MVLMRVLAGATDESASDSDAAAVQRVLRDRLVTPLFQPIVELATGAVVGVEALARGPAGTALELPDQLLAAAAAAGLLGAIDMLCAERALECAVESPVVPPLVFVNAESAVLDQPLSPRLVQLLLSGPPFRVVTEYIERALSTAPAALLRIAGMSHGLGNGVALDDVGADPMSLAFLPYVEPDVIKLDMHLLRHPHAAATAEVCAVVAATARRTGAMVIAEGIETEADVATAQTLGANWGQGWHFGRPAPLADLSLPDIRQTAHLRVSRPGLHQPAGSPFEVAAAGSAFLVDGEAVLRALDDMSAAVDDEKHAVVLGSYGAAEDVDQWRPQIERVMRQALYASVLRPDGTVEPFPGESCLVIMTPNHAAALCRGPNGRVLHTLERETVTLIGRVLLQRLTSSTR